MGRRRTDQELLADLERRLIQLQQRARKRVRTKGIRTAKRLIHQLDEALHLVRSEGLLPEHELILALAQARRILNRYRLSQEDREEVSNGPS